MTNIFKAFKHFLLFKTPTNTCLIFFISYIKKIHFNHDSQRNNEIAADDTCCCVRFHKIFMFERRGWWEKKIVAQGKFNLHIMLLCEIVKKKVFITEDSTTSFFRALFSQTKSKEISSDEIIYYNAFLLLFELHFITNFIRTNRERFNSALFSVFAMSMCTQQMILGRQFIAICNKKAIF